MYKRLTLFSLPIFIGVLFLGWSISLADNIPGKDQAQNYPGRESNRDHLTKSQGQGFDEGLNKDPGEGSNEDLNEDLGDFFEDPPDPDSLSQDPSGSDPLNKDPLSNDPSDKSPMDLEAQDLDDFFSDDKNPPEDTQIPDSITGSGETNWFLDGSIGLKVGSRFNHDPPLPGGTDHRGLSDLRGEIQLEFGSKVFGSWDFFISGSGFYNLAYKLNHDNYYTEEFLENYEKELELDKLFIRGSLLSALDIKIGRQIVIWGRSDNIRVTDVLNPLDLREPGMTDIEDLRLPVFMTRLDYYFGDFTLSGFAIHEHRSNKLPVYGSSYYYLPFPLPDETDPPNSFENTEFALSLSGTFPGFDISFYLADLYDDFAYLNAENMRLHEKISMAGLAANKTHGNFLYKAEAAYFDDIRLSAFPQQGALVDNTKDYSRFEFLAGIEYSGFTDTRLSLEAADKYITNYDDNAQRSGAQENVVQYAIRLSRTFYHEVFELTLLASLYGKKADEGGFLRAQGTYDLSDATSLTLGVVFYESGPSPLLKGIGQNDTVFSSFTYSF